MSKPPFQKSAFKLKETFGISIDTAVQRVQNHYRSFKTRNDRLLERQNDLTNVASSNLTNQITLLATATLTFAGAFVGTLHESMTQAHILLFLVIALCELVALTLAVAEYKTTTSFHNRWAKVYFEIDQEVERRIEDGTLQETNQLSEIESKKINSNLIDKETNQNISKYMSISGIVGTWLFFLLISVYFFDVPFFSGS